MKRGLLLLLILLGACTLGACQQACQLGEGIPCEENCWPRLRIGPICSDLCEPFDPTDECAR